MILYIQIKTKKATGGIKMETSREERIIKEMKEKYEKVKEKAAKQKQKWQFVINSEDKTRLLNTSIDIMNFGGTSGYKVATQFIIGVDNKNKNFYVFSENNSDIIGYAIYKLPFDYIEDIGVADGDDHWLKITEHKPETIEKKIRKVERYIERNRNNEKAKDIRMYEKWQNENQ